MWAALLLAWSAGAAEGWALLEDALLVESVYGDLESAARTYEQLVRRLAVDDPSRAEALLALGRARAELGEPDLARAALLEGIRTASCLDPCQDLLGRIELEQESITRIPVRWTFDDADHGFFHPWQFDDKGTIRLERTRANDMELVWSTVIDIRKGDQLVVGFRRPQPTPRRVQFEVRSEATDAWLQVIFIDDHGRSYAVETGAFWVPVGRTTFVDVDLQTLHPIDPLDPPFDPGRVSRLQIRDVSAVEGARPGPNTMYLDDFTVR